MFDYNDTKGLPLNRTPNTVGIAAFNLDTINQLLDSKGILAFHIKHCPDPKSYNMQIGKPINNSNIDFMFYDIRPIRVVPYSMNAEALLMQYSLETLSTKVILNVGGYYLDNLEEKERVLVRPNDLFIFNPSITMGNQEIVKVTNSKEVKLPQYVQKVDHIVDDSGRVYNPYFDIKINNGVISFNESFTDRIMSIVYEHSLIYTVDQIPHYLRILQANENGAGSEQRQAVYAPQLVVCNFVKTHNFGDGIYDWFQNEKIKNYQQFLNIGKYN